MYTHDKEIITAGKSLSETSKAMVLIHGRGATAQNILGLRQELPLDGFSLYAPQATNHSWYPYSFMAPEKQNQPALNSALELIGAVVQEIMQKGVDSKNIYFLGFSQGACLTLEYLSRNARQYGGIIAFTGGLIGEKLDTSRYGGDFAQTPVHLSTGDPDPHVPLSRVQETVKVLESMGAEVQLKVYQGRPHSILPEELALAGQLITGQGKNHGQ